MKQSRDGVGNLMVFLPGGYAEIWLMYRVDGG